MRRMQQTFYFISLLFILALMEGCGRRDAVVAKIDGRVQITIQDLMKYAGTNAPKDVDLKISLSQAREYLNQLIDQNLLILAARQEKLDQDSSLQAVFQNQKNSLMLQALFKKLVIQYVIPESDVREFYSRMGKEIVMRKIFFGCLPGASREEEKSVQAKAENIIRQLKNGKDFSELARLYSEDQTTASNGGLIESLTWSPTNDPVQRAAFSLKEGQYSGLIRDSQGIHIVYVEEIQKKERKPLKQVREQIIRQLLDARRKQIEKRQAEIENKTRKQISIRWQESALDSLVGFFSQDSVFDRNSLMTCLDSLPAAVKETPLLHWFMGDWTVRDFRKLAGEQLSPYFKGNLSNKQEIQRMVEQELLMDGLIHLATKQKLDKDPVIMNQMREIHERSMLNIMQGKINVPINPTTDSLRIYFEQNISKWDIEPERVAVQEILLPNKKLAIQTYKRALEGENFDQLAEQYTIRTTYKSQKGILPEIRIDAKGILGEKAFAMELGEISEPLPVEKGQYSIIKLLNRLPAVHDSFDHVQYKVMQDYIDTRKKEAIAAFLFLKKNEFGGVQINNQILEQHFHD